jgi:hypothetical protein
MGDNQNTEESYNNISSCNPRNNDIGRITGHVTLIWNDFYSAWKLRNQDRRRALKNTGESYNNNMCQATTSLATPDTMILDG